MRYYELEPEVAGGLGPKTDIDNTVHPPVVTRLHYEFDGWAGDALLASFPCYIVTQQLKEEFAKAELTGYEFAEVFGSVSPEFEELLPGVDLPNFFWLKATGEAGTGDFGLSPGFSLVVSQRVMAILGKVDVSHCDKSDYVDQ